MSSNLYWKPEVEYKGTLDDSLKFALREEYGEPVNTTLNCNDVSFIRGLEVGNVRGATKLLKLISKHGSIIIREEY